MFCYICCHYILIILYLSLWSWLNVAISLFNLRDFQDHLHDRGSMAAWVLLTDHVCANEIAVLLNTSAYIELTKVVSCLSLARKKGRSLWKDLFKWKHTIIMSYFRKSPLESFFEGIGLEGVEFPQKQNKNQMYSWVSEASKHEQLERSWHSQCHRKRKDDSSAALHKHLL